MQFKSSVIVLAAIAELVAGHGAIVKAVGDMGGMGTALGGKLLVFSHAKFASLLDSSH